MGRVVVELDQSDNRPTTQLYRSRPSSGMTLLAGCGVTFILVAMVIWVVALPFIHGWPRSVEGSPLDLVSDDMSGRLTRLTDQLQAQGVQITDLGAQIASMTLSVAFTVTFSGRDLEGLDHRKGTLRFDKVLLNAGDGYDANTGVFRAPKAGLYAFDIHVTRHLQEPEPCVEVHLYKGEHEQVCSVSACVGRRDLGSSRTVVSLQQGDTVHSELVVGSRLLGNHHTAWSGLRL